MLRRRHTAAMHIGGDELIAQALVTFFASLSLAGLRTVRRERRGREMSIPCNNGSAVPQPNEFSSSTSRRS
jgi:hypothetical protein